MKAEVGFKPTETSCRVRTIILGLQFTAGIWVKMRSVGFNHLASRTVTAGDEEEEEKEEESAEGEEDKEKVKRKRMYRPP